MSLKGWLGHGIVRKTLVTLTKLIPHCSFNLVKSHKDLKYAKIWCQFFTGYIKNVTKRMVWQWYYI